VSRSDGAEHIDPRIRQRRESVERSRTHRRLRWAAALLAVAALVALGVGLLHTPLFGAKVVRVTGNHPNTTDAAILQAAGLVHRPPLISVDPAGAAARVETLPFVASAQVTRDWPDGVTVHVTERVPVATMGATPSGWATLDGAGRTLAVAAARPDHLPALVVHGPAGTTVAPAPVGGTVARAAEPGLRVARTLPPAFAAQVGTVTVAADGTVSLALDANLVVLLGTTSDLTAKYEDVAAIIAHAPLRGAHTIDVTVPQSPTVGP
jgi:cell division protein FtsQ